MKRISIDTTMARIDVRTINARLSVRSPKMSFRVNNAAPKLNARLPKPNFNSQNTNTRPQENIGLPGEMSKSEAMALPGSNPLAEENAGVRADMAAQNGMTSDTARAQNLGNQIREDVENSLRPLENDIPTVAAEREIVWERGDDELSTAEGGWKPEVQVEPYSVEVQLKQKASVRVTVSEDAEPIHRAEGRQVDQVS